MFLIREYGVVDRLGNGPISDIMDYFLAGADSNKPISLTTWLAVNP